MLAFFFCMGIQASFNTRIVFSSIMRMEIAIKKRDNATWADAPTAQDSEPEQGTIHALALFCNG